MLYFVVDEPFIAGIQYVQVVEILSHNDGPIDTWILGRTLSAPVSKPPASAPARLLAWRRLQLAAIEQWDVSLPDAANPVRLEGLS